MSAYVPSPAQHVCGACLERFNPHEGHACEKLTKELGDWKQCAELNRIAYQEMYRDCMDLFDKIDKLSAELNAAEQRCYERGVLAALEIVKANPTDCCFEVVARIEGLTVDVMK